MIALADNSFFVIESGCEPGCSDTIYDKRNLHAAPSGDEMCPELDKGNTYTN